MDPALAVACCLDCEDFLIFNPGFYKRVVRAIYAGFKAGACNKVVLIRACVFLLTDYDDYAGTLI